MHEIFKYINHSNLDTVAELLEQNSKLIHVKDSTNMTPLLWATYNENLFMVEYLLKYSPDLNAKDNAGYTALHFAVEQENYDITECLLNAGANPSVQDSKGRTPFLIATASNQRAHMILLSKYLELESMEI